MDKIFSWIGDLFSKIWGLFKKILPYIMIALAVFFTFGGSLTLFGMVLEGYAAAIAAMGLSFLVAPDATIDVVSGVAKDIGTAAGAIVSGAAGGIASGLFGDDGSWLLVAAFAVGAYLLLSRKEDDSTRVAELTINDQRETGSDDEVAVGTLRSASSNLGSTIV